MGASGFQATAWLDAMPVTDKAVEALIAEGWWGISLGDLSPWLLKPRAVAQIAETQWVKVTGGEGAEVVLMTSDESALDKLLDWMLSAERECPKVFGPDDEQPSVPDALPSLRPTAFNLPAGQCSEEVLDDDLLEGIEEIFQDLKQSFGAHASLHCFDYGTFMEHLDNKVLFLTGQFIDLDTREIYEFTMDGGQQRMRYHSTGTFVGS